MITAHNPGRTLSAADNVRHQHDLDVHLHGLPGLQVWTAVGGNRGWTHSEESLAVIGLTDEEAMEIGAMFHQDAIFAWSPQSLKVLACDASRARATGWEASERPDPRPQPTTTQKPIHEVVRRLQELGEHGDDVEDDNDDEEDDEDPGGFWELPAGVALVAFSYDIDGGTGSPGSDDSGSGCLFIWNGQLWTGFSDPGETELYSVQDVYEAVRKFVTDMRQSLPGTSDWIGWGPAADQDLRARLGPELHIA